MATAAPLLRNPLATRSQLNDSGMPISPCRTTLKKQSAVKRPLSPEPTEELRDHSSKRAKTNASRAPVVQESPTPAAAARAEAKKEKERQKEKDRSDREEVFKTRYTRAFPGWVFYFDFELDNPESTTRTHLEKRVAYMGARHEKFFSREITHFITLHDIDDKENKEKAPAKRGASATAAATPGALGSPIRLRGRAPTNAATGGTSLDKAKQLGMKIWSAAKLHSILDRCDVPRASTSNGTLPNRHEHLATLLKSEQLHGTMERDPTQRRHDYTYFSKDSYFVLVEDIRQELATIAATEYPIQRGKDGKEMGAWPVLYCHPLSRGPFLEYDDKEERRRQKVEKAEKERVEERALRKAQLAQRERKRKALQLRQRAAAAQQHDLRRSASMNNLRRSATLPSPALDGFVDLDADFLEETQPESVNASGYLASGAYMAASGNSVSIASTTGGGTSTAGPLRSLTLPPHLREKMQHQVTMPRRASASVSANGSALPTAERGNKENVMGPPATIPERAKFLRKSKSTTTLKLPKRDEASKPGYCECCRLKFEDFREHIKSKKHRKFAQESNNFRRLDEALARVRRRTVEEVAAAEAAFLADALEQTDPAPVLDEDEAMLPQLDDVDAPADEDDVRWEEWVDAGRCEVEV